jgi:16S rRNA (cytidine1402-2'-O)-methyltransferase
LLDLHGTLVLFESSHRIEALLKQIALVFPQNLCVVAKELTKLHEQFLRGSAAQLLARLRDDQALTKGEFVVLVDNPVNAEDRHLNTDDVEMLKILLDEVSVKIAVKIAIRLTGKKKNELYQQALQLRNQTGSGATN